MGYARSLGLSAAVIIALGLAACGGDPTVIVTEYETIYWVGDVSVSVPDTPPPLDAFVPWDVGPDATEQDTVHPAPSDASLSDALSSDADSMDDLASEDVGLTDLGVEDGESTPDVAPELPSASYEPTRYPSERIISPINVSVADGLRAITDNDPLLDDSIFMKVGASSTVSTNNLNCFAGDYVDLGADAWLQATLEFFLAGDAEGTTPFDRTTHAAKSGMSTGWSMSGDPSPIDEEMNDIAPRYALIHYGTNDMHLGTTFESAIWNFGNQYLDLVELLSSRGVIPMCFAIAARGDSQAADHWVDAYNSVIRGVAQARQVPFIDMHYALDPLEGHGLAGDGIHLNTFISGGYYRACLLSEEGLEHGFNMRNRVSLMALDAMRQVVVTEVDALDDGVPMEGDGALETPFIIEELPYTHMENTALSPWSELDIYGGCDASQDESGPEYLYRFEVSETTRIRAMVFDRGDVDVDIHLLDDSGSEAGCLDRAHQILEATLEPGVYHFSLDTFVVSSGPLWGEYLFTVVRCRADDAACGG